MKTIKISQSKLRLVYLFEKVINIYGPDYHADSALLHLLKKHIVNLPNPDDYFHKAFRQCDIIPGDKGTTDIIIHKLLSQSKDFWRVFPKCKNDNAIINPNEFNQYCQMISHNIAQSTKSDEDKMIDARTTFYRAVSNIRSKEGIKKMWDELPVAFRHEIDKKVTQAIVERHLN